MKPLLISIVCLLPAAANASGLLHYVSDYYEGSPRSRVDSMSRDDAKKFDATGTLFCKGTEGSAQLTVSNNLITTASHMLYHRKKGTNSCEQRAKATDCTFQVFSHGRIRSIPVTEMVGKGWTCPNGADPADDWLVFKLAESVDDVQPYQINYSKIKSMRENENVMTVAHSIDIFGKAKHYGFCKIGHLENPGFIPHFLIAPCGCAEGCSGGSLLSADSDHNLLGIVVAGKESDKELRQALQSGHPNRYHFRAQGDDQDRGELYVAITNDFLKAIEKGSGLNLAGEATKPENSPPIPSADSDATQPQETVPLPHPRSDTR